MDKIRFTSSFDYQLAQGLKEYKGQPPVDPKFAGMCQRDMVAEFGAASNEAVGVCELAEKCSYANSKTEGVTGFCLKSVVGVEIQT
jgi:hypothetical protein